MKNLKVSAKLLAGFGIAVLFTLVVGLESMFQLERLNKDYTDAIGEFVADNAENSAEFDLTALNRSTESGIAFYKQNRYRTATIFAVSLVFFVILGLYITGLISKPLHAAVNMIKEMGKGQLSGRLRLNRKDEFGVLADAIDKFAENLRVSLIDPLNRISDGELTVEFPNNGAGDEFGAALKRIVRHLRQLVIEDGGRVLMAAACLSTCQLRPPAP